ncbi:MAG: hypothetical protein DHS20C15_13160 [Planctomycetota bacterium]|nr:MAG: hypothetical protein DHS20C15_13160 [Planctomycetota bacterium]
MLTSTRFLTRAALGMLALTATASALPTPSDREMLVAVWTEAGQLLTQDIDVTATTAGQPVKGLQQSSGHFVLPNAGTATDYGMKATIEVIHPFYGSKQVDVSLDAAANVTLDLIFGLDGKLRAFGDALIPVTQRSQSGFAGIAVVNDLCADAISLGANDSTNGTTVGATFDGVEACGTPNTAPGVWYTVTGTGNTMTATTCSPNTDFDSKISVFCGDCDALNCIGGNDDDINCVNDTLQSTFSWCSQEGATYYVLVHAFDVNVGNFELTMIDGAACDTPVGCLPTGACCVDGGCSILTPPECANLGGQYQGDASECTSLLGTRDFDSGDLNLAIPDFDPTGLTDSIFVTNPYTVGDVNLEVSIDHTWTGDLQVFLEHDGVEVLVVDRPQFPVLPFGCDQDNWIAIQLDDEGTGGAIEDQCQLGGNLTSPPAYTPASTLSAFDGMSARGRWNLRIVDNADMDLGSLVSWKLSLGKSSGVSPCDEF